MYEIVRKLKKDGWKPSRHKIYTEEEYKQQAGAWRGCQAGDYGLTDDGFVAECFDVKTYKGNTLHIFSFGKQWGGRSNKLEFMPHLRANNFCGVSTVPHAVREARRARTRRAVQLYVNYIVNGVEIDWMKIGKIYRPEHNHPDWMAKRLFKMTEVKEMIDQEITEILKRKGITKETVLDMRMEAWDVAKKRKDLSKNVGDAGIMLRVVEGLEKLLDMHPSPVKVKKELRITDGGDKNILSLIESEERNPREIAQEAENEENNQLLQENEVEAEVPEEKVVSPE